MLVLRPYTVAAWYILCVPLPLTLLRLLIMNIEHDKVQSQLSSSVMHLLFKADHSYRLLGGPMLGKTPFPM